MPIFKLVKNEGAATIACLPYNIQSIHSMSCILAEFEQQIFFKNSEQKQKN
jgi:hypothetical protein